MSALLYGLLALALAIAAISACKEWRRIRAALRGEPIPPPKRWGK